MTELAITLAGLNLWIRSPWFGLLAGAIIIFFLNYRRHNLSQTIVISLSWISIVGAFFYYTYKLDNFTILLTWLSLPLPFFFIKAEQTPNVARRLPQPWSDGLAVVIGSLLMLLLWYHRTGESIVSPWPQVPTTFFILLFILLAIYLFAPSKFKLGLILVTASSIALFIYKYGFGFDPFIHQAAERYIVTHGAITPKTFYYIGQYALVVTLAKLFAIDPTMLDAVLLPIGGSLILASLLFKSFGRYGVFLLLLPIGYFIATTPFGLALLFFLMLLLLEIQGASSGFEILVATAIFMIHPLVGIPAFILLGGKVASKYQWFKARWGQALFIIAGASLLPLVFMKIGAFAPHFPSLSIPSDLFTRRFEFWLDLLHLYELVLYPTLVIFGLWAAKKYRPDFLRLFIILAGSGLYIKYFIKFQNLPSYEQENFADRVLWLALILLLLPLIIWLKEKIEIKQFYSRLTKSLFWSAVIIGIIFSIYLSYPRKDNYTVAKGWNTSSADLATVQQIEEDAHGKPYIVLANQSTSAAALTTFGFRYLKSDSDEFFFYPIPTSSRLYEYYLDLVYRNNTKRIMLQAMDYAHVDLGYFAVSNYWWTAKKIIDRSKTWADQWFAVDNGAITVFKVRR